MGREACPYTPTVARYPPDKQERATQIVLEQAEHLCKLGRVTIHRAASPNLTLTN